MTVLTAATVTFTSKEDSADVAVLRDDDGIPCRVFNHLDVRDPVTVDQQQISPGAFHTTPKEN